MQYFNAKQSAKYLGKSDKTIRRWIKSGQLKAKKESGKFCVSKRSLSLLKRQASGQVSVNLSGENGWEVDNVRSQELSKQRRISRQLQDILEAIKGSKTAIVSRDENPLIEELRRERDVLSGH